MHVYDYDNDPWFRFDNAKSHRNGFVHKQQPATMRILRIRSYTCIICISTEDDATDNVREYEVTLHNRRPIVPVRVFQTKKVSKHFQTLYV